MSRPKRREFKDEKEKTRGWSKWGHDLFKWLKRLHYACVVWDESESIWREVREGMSASLMEIRKWSRSLRQEFWLEGLKSKSEAMAGNDSTGLVKL